MVTPPPSDHIADTPASFGVRTGNDYPSFERGDLLRRYLSLRRADPSPSSPRYWPVTKSIVLSLRDPILRILADKAAMNGGRAGRCSSPKTIRSPRLPSTLGCRGRVRAARRRPRHQPCPRRWPCPRAGSTTSAGAPEIGPRPHGLHVARTAPALQLFSSPEGGICSRSSSDSLGQCAQGPRAAPTSTGPARKRALSHLRGWLSGGEPSRGDCGREGLERVSCTPASRIAQAFAEKMRAAWIDRDHPRREIRGP